jgi:hypothetical protein
VSEFVTVASTLNAFILSFNLEHVFL